MAIRLLAILGVLAPLNHCIVAGEAAAGETVEVRVYPTIERRIGGISELDREVYFAMCDHGSGFGRRVGSKERGEYLLDELGATFGRNLAPIKGVAGSPDQTPEDPQRPGHADLDALGERLSKRSRDPLPWFERRVRGRLQVAAHGLSREYPVYMGEHTTPQAERDNHKHKHVLPGDPVAAAEYAAVALEAGYSDFDRPAFFEPINEPHWSFVSSEQLAAWHTETRRAVQERGLDVKVGGPCLSVAYFYRRGFTAFDGLKEFMANTNGELDFYSFHAYDYLKWDGSSLVGRVTSGLPLEGVLDLVQAHAVHEYGKEVDLVISEHGGYISGKKGQLNADEVGKLLTAESGKAYEGFERTLYERSVSSHVLVSAAIANTLAFMDHPHVLKKATPFILIESMGWDPHYYSTMYVAHEFTDRGRWVETRNTDFYKFFRDLKGRRVYVRGGDPDLQVRAFVDGDRLRVVVNNVSNESHPLRITLPAGEGYSVRRYGRNDDYTPSLSESTVDSLATIEVAPREALLVTAKYAEPIPTRRVVDETPRYGNRIAQQPAEGKPARFVVKTPDDSDVAYATLRFGVTRPTGADPNVVVRINGKRLTVPVEDAVGRLDDGEQEYASTKVVSFDPDWLRPTNRVEVGFPDDDGGAIGAVVIRVGAKQPPNERPQVATRPR